MYRTIAAGGTFDRLHNGHKHILRQAFLLGEMVVIGVMSDEFANSKLKIQNSKAQVKIQKFEDRKSDLEDFLKKENLLERVKIVQISDLYGGLDTKTDVQAILVTRESRAGADKINAMRKKRGLSELEVKEVPMLAAQDEEKISSTRIREGEIDREGSLYKATMQQFSNATISEEVRRELKKPQGKLLKGKTGDAHFWKKKLVVYLENSFVISVGDEVTKTLNLIQKTAHISIFDYCIQRKKIFSRIEDLGFSLARSHLAKLEVVNPAGKITKDLVEIVDVSIKSAIVTNIKQLIIVDGEEDLAAVPAILLAPLGAKVIYGQPNEGVVVVDVTEEKKKILEILQ